MNRPIKVALYGVGVLSSMIAKALLNKKGVEIVSAIDIAEDKVGRDVGGVIGHSRKLGVTVSKNIKEAFAGNKPDIVIHTTTSMLKQVHPQIKECLEEGANVVSTCEELSNPYLKDEAITKDMDKIAKENGVSVLGTGINPGFLMDTLPITITGPCLDVKHIKVTRMMNSGKRRIPFQKKVGTGLTEEEFREKMDKKEITGHVGLDISISLIARALNWHLDEIVDIPPEPVIAERAITTNYATVNKGQVAGLKDVAYGVKDGQKVIELEFIAHAGVEGEYDSTEIEGKPNIKLKIEGGVHGDIGTVAMVINSIPKVINALPGLYTMKDMPVPSATPDDLNKYIKE